MEVADIDRSGVLAILKIDPIMKTTKQGHYDSAGQCPGGQCIWVRERHEVRRNRNGILIIFSGLSGLNDLLDQEVSFFQDQGS